MATMLSRSNFASLPSERYTRCVLPNKHASAPILLAGVLSFKHLMLCRQTSVAFVHLYCLIA